jgi:hypothetical protein
VRLSKRRFAAGVALSVVAACLFFWASKKDNDIPRGKQATAVETLQAQMKNERVADLYVTILQTYQLLLRAVMTIGTLAFFIGISLVHGSFKQSEQRRPIVFAYSASWLVLAAISLSAEVLYPPRVAQTLWPLVLVIFLSAPFASAVVGWQIYKLLVEPAPGRVQDQEVGTS